MNTTLFLPVTSVNVATDSTNILLQIKSAALFSLLIFLTSNSTFLNATTRNKINSTHHAPTSPLLSIV